MGRAPTPGRPIAVEAVRAPALPLLVETRFHVPVPGPAVVERPTVLASLDRYADRRVTLIAAPTGFGKTTTLALWLRSRRRRYAWLSLESAENDPVRFATYVVSAIRRALPDVGGSALAALQNARVDIATDVVGSVVNDIAKRDDQLVLVLDDYYLIRDPACDSILATLVAELPPQLRLIIATRADPSIPIGRLRATGDLGEIRAEDLRFTSAEIRTFFGGWLSMDLDDPTLAALEERTEGWPAALNLAQLSISGSADPKAFLRTFTGSHRHVVDYLTSEVLDALSADTRKFLLRTSVLDRLSGDLCDAVAGMADSATRLVDLERSNLFLMALDGDRHWFRYHRMFRDAMRAELRAEYPRLAPRLLAKAASWHEADGSLEEAIRYAIAADDHDLAGAIIARHYQTFTHGGHLRGLRDLIHALDVARLTTTRGSVAFVAALAAGLDGERVDVIEGHVAELEAYGAGAGIPAGIPSTEAGVAVVRSAYLGDDVGHQRAAGARLLAGWPDHPYLANVGRLALGFTAYLQNDFARATEVLVSFGSVAVEDPPVITIIGTSVRALAELEAGHVEAGVAAAREAHAAITRQGLGDAAVSAIVHEALGASLIATDRPAEAVALLERAVSLTLTTRPVQRAAKLLTLARAQLASGDPSGALRHTGEARSLIEASRDPGALPARLSSVEHLLTGPHRRSEGLAPSVAELRVLRLLPSTLSQREIAAQLYLSPETVKTHVRRLYQKLDATSRSEAIDRAVGVGLLASGQGRVSWPTERDEPRSASRG